VFAYEPFCWRKKAQIRETRKFTHNAVTKLGGGTSTHSDIFTRGGIRDYNLLNQEGGPPSEMYQLRHGRWVEKALLGNVVKNPSLLSEVSEKESLKELPSFDKKKKTEKDFYEPRSSTETHIRGEREKWEFGGGERRRPVQDHNWGGKLKRAVGLSQTSGQRESLWVGGE